MIPCPKCKSTMVKTDGSLSGDPDLSEAERMNLEINDNALLTCPKCGFTEVTEVREELLKKK